MAIDIYTLLLQIISLVVDVLTHPPCPLLISVKTLGDLRFSNAFRGKGQKGTVGRSGINRNRLSMIDRSGSFATEISISVLVLCCIFCCKYCFNCSV